MKILLNNREIEYQIKKSIRARRLRVVVYCDARVIGKVMRIGGGRREDKKHCEQAREFVLKKIESINKIYKFCFKKISIRNQLKFLMKTFRLNMIYKKLIAITLLTSLLFAKIEEKEKPDPNNPDTEKLRRSFLDRLLGR